MTLKSLRVLQAMIIVGVSLGARQLVQKSIARGDDPLIVAGITVVWILLVVAIEIIGDRFKKS